MKRPRAFVAGIFVAVTFLAATFMAATPLSVIPARAQTPMQKTLPQPERTFNLTLEQRHTIKEILKDATVDKAAGNIPVTPGAAVPANVTLHDMPAVLAQKVPQIKSHQFFLTGDKVVIVEPKDKKVADVIE